MRTTKKISIWMLTLMLIIVSISTGIPVWGERVLIEDTTLSNDRAAIARRERDRFINGENVSEEITITLEDQLRAIENNNNMTEAQRAQAIEKLQVTSDLMDAISSPENASLVRALASGETTYAMARSLPWWAIDMTRQPRRHIVVPHNRQANGWFCGPATVRQTMQHLWGGGYSRTQHEIAAIIGTTQAGTNGLNMVTYINNRQNFISYVVIQLEDQVRGSVENRLLMEVCFWEAFTLWHTTPILRVRMRVEDGWRYRSDGHFMNVSGFEGGGSRDFEVTDPAESGSLPGRTPGRFVYSSQVIWRGTNIHPQRHFYY